MHIEQVWKQCSSGIYKVLNHGGSDLSLFEKRLWQSFEISFEWFMLLWNKGYTVIPIWRPPWGGEGKMRCYRT